MSKTERRNAVKEKLKNAAIMLELAKEVDEMPRENQERFKLVKETLSELGVFFEVERKTLFISINPEVYAGLTRKTAGRRTKTVRIDGKDSHGDGLCRYSDVLNMLTKMSDSEVREKLGMSQSTYFRHKKKMLEKELVRSIDRHILKDLELLKEALGREDFLF